MGDNPFTAERFAFFNQANRIAAENNTPIFFPGKRHNPKPHDPRGGGHGGGNEQGGGGGGGGGDGLPTLPDGFAFIVDDGSRYLVNGDGDFITATNG